MAAGSRAAQAAARVAARYAHAPSYSQMQAAEALHPSPQKQEPKPLLELVGRAAKDGEPAAASVQPAASAGSGATILPATPAAPDASVDQDESAILAESAAPDWLQASESEYPSIAWEPDSALRLAPGLSYRTLQKAEDLSFSGSGGWEPTASAGIPGGSESIESIEPVEPDLPIQANLIEFPRELVATRKMRPRLLDGPLTDLGAGRQLSIFEVDPGALSTQPEPAGSAPAEAWPALEWQGLEIETQSREEAGFQPAEQTRETQPALQLAPIGQRLMAALVDGALIVGAFLGAALLALSHVARPPSAKPVECGAFAALVLVGLLYQAFFLILTGATPGMKYAGISLCSFDGLCPTRAQLRSRLGALLLSVLPLGLGIAWVLLDDDRLSWHDRLSQTYPRAN